MKKITQFKPTFLIFLLIGIVIIAVVVFRIGRPAQRSVIDRVWSDYEKTTVYINDHVVQAVIADTAEKRTQGLSDTEHLPKEGGMLFVFEEPSIQSFWMKDMHYDLDILWLNIDGEIVHSVESVSPASYPATFTNIVPARYVVELPGGACKKYTCAMGDTIYFSL